MLKLAAVQHSGCVLRNIVARPWLVCSQSHRPNFGLASRAVTTAPGESGDDVGNLTVKHSIVILLERRNNRY